MTPGLAEYKLGFELSPIIFTNGIAQDLPNSQLPIISILQNKDFENGLLDGTYSLDFNDYFANFKPMVGAQLVNNQIGLYPFANQTVAANAIVTQPLTISMLMTCPARPSNGGYFGKLQILTALKQAIEQHNNDGGTYTIVTPSFIYSECVMTGFVDVSGGDTRQIQTDWRLDFMRPLLTEEDAEQAMNSLMNKIDGGLPIDGEPSWSGPDNQNDPITGNQPGVVTSDNLRGSSINVFSNQALA